METDTITNTIAIYHQGSGDDHRLWTTSSVDGVNYTHDAAESQAIRPLTGIGAVYDTATGTTWCVDFPASAEEDRKDLGGLQGTTPAITIFQGNLYTFYIASNYTLCYRIGTGAYVTIANVVATTNPNPVVFTPQGSTQPQLYVFYSGSDNQLWYATTTDGSTWVAYAVGSYGPVTEFYDVGVVVYTPPFSVPNLYVFFNYYDSVMFITTPDVKTWTRHPEIPGVKLTDGPCAVVLDNATVKNTLLVFHSAYAGKSALYYTSTADGDNWSADTKITSGVGVSYKPGVVIEPRSSTSKPELKHLPSME
jgi:hypothetical protein